MRTILERSQILLVVWFAVCSQCDINKRACSASESGAVVPARIVIKILCLYSQRMPAGGGATVGLFAGRLKLYYEWCGLNVGLTLCSRVTTHAARLAVRPQQHQTVGNIRGYYSLVIHIVHSKF